MIILAGVNLIIRMAIRLIRRTSGQLKAESVRFLGRITNDDHPRQAILWHKVLNPSNLETNSPDGQDGTIPVARESDWTTNVVFQLHYGLELGPNGSSTTRRSRQILLWQSWTVLVWKSGIFLGHKKAHNKNPTNSPAILAGKEQSLDPSMALGYSSRILWTNPESGRGVLDIYLHV